MLLLLSTKVVWPGNHHGGHKLKRLLKMNQMSFGKKYVTKKEILHGYILCMHMQVTQKTQQKKIGRTDAILEVYTDRIVEKVKNIDDALLWIFKQNISEFSVCMTME